MKRAYQEAADAVSQYKKATDEASKTQWEEKALEAKRNFDELKNSLKSTTEAASEYSSSADTMGAKLDMSISELSDGSKYVENLKNAYNNLKEAVSGYAQAKKSGDMDGAEYWQTQVDSSHE